MLVVLRSDGSSLYATKDLHLAIKKFEEWNIDRSIYVIDVRQSLYMKQIFKALELMGFKQALNCYHLAYEIVNLPGDVTMSSREGTVVMFDDLLQEAVKRARDIVQQKNPGLSGDLKEKVALSVALGGLKYPLLAVDTNKVATFDWETARKPRHANRDANTTYLLGREADALILAEDRAYQDRPRRQAKYLDRQV